MMGRHRLAALGLILAGLLAMAHAPRAAEQRVEAPAAGEPAAPPVLATVPAVIDTRDAPSLGADNAPVTIVEFGDFQCPFCARGAKSLRKLVAIYPDRVRWVFMHYPLRSVHPEAALAHEAAAAAQEQGKFWEMHELILQNQTHVRYPDLVGYAEQIGLNMATFKGALDTRRLRRRVIHDLEEGRRLRVGVTPTYFINGVRYAGARSTTEFRALVDVTIRRAAAPATPGDAAGAPVESSPTR